MIVLTGGTGQLGGEIIRAASQAFRREDLRISTRNPAAAAESDTIETRKGDFDDPSTLAKAFDRADQVVIVSANGSDDERLIRNRNAIDAAVAAGAGHIVLISFAPVAHGLHLVHAEAVKRAEDHLVGSGVPYTILRCNYYAEIFLMFAQTAIETGEILLPGGEGKAAMISRVDIARCVVAALQDDFARGHIFELSGPQSVGYADLAQTIAEVTGKPITYRAAETDEAEAWGNKLPVPPEWVPHIVYAAREIGDGYFDHVTDDVAKLIGHPGQPATQVWKAALTAN